MASVLQSFGSDPLKASILAEAALGEALTAHHGLSHSYQPDWCV